MQFGEYLKQRRLERGWTQPEAALKAGIEQSYLSKLETGKSVPSGEVYQRLVAAFDIDTAAMAGVLFPAELDRLREVDAVRELLLREQRDTRAISRRWMLGGLALLAVGGGLVGLALAEGQAPVDQFTYQSTGVILPGESLDVFAGLDQNPDPSAPDYEARLAERNRLIARVDDQTRTSLNFKGPAVIETAPGGKRVWQLVGSSKVTPPRAFAWAGAAGWAAILGGLGCFFISWRWPNPGSARRNREEPRS